MSETDTAGASADVWQAPALDPGDTPQGRRRARAEALAQRSEAAVERGYREGFERGLSEAKDRAKRLERVLDHLAQPLQELDQSVADSLVDLACQIARQVVRRELQVDRTQVIQIAREAIDALPASARNVRVVMHPADAELVGELLDDIGSERRWQLDEDPLLARGGLRIVSESSTIDQRVEQRLQRIVGRIVRDERAEPRAEDS